MTDSILPKGEVASVRDQVFGFLRYCHWPSLISGAALGFAGLYFQTTQPLISQIKQLERRVCLFDSNLHRLAGTTADAAHANNLLGALIAQGARVDAAQAALDSLINVERALEISAERATAAGEIVTRWDELAGQVIATRDQQGQVQRAIEQIDSLQQDVVALGTAADVQQADIAASRAVLTSIANLQQELIATTEGTGAARNALEGIDALQQRLVVAAAGTNAAQQSAEQLIALQQNLASVGNTDSSAANAERLLALHNSLSGNVGAQIEAASQNAAELVRLQQSLSGQTGQIAAGVENLDLLADFQDELALQLQKVEELRRQLTELMLLEATVAKTVTAMKPLAELGDLRRLDDADIRAAVRTMLDRHRERVATDASKYDDSVPATTDSVATERLVPEPPAE